MGNNNPLHKLILIIFLACALLWFGNAVEAGTETCEDLARPLHKEVNQVKGQHGGLWDQFEKGRQLQDHSVLALRLDSKVAALLYTLDYLCATQEGIPYNELAASIIPRIKEMGEVGFIEFNLNNGVTEEEARGLIEFAKFAEAQRHRKLDIAQIRKTMGQAGVLVGRYLTLSDKIFRGNTAKDSINEAKSLSNDIDTFHATDPYLKQADYENSQVPHSTLAGQADQM